MDRPGRKKKKAGRCIEVVSGGSTVLLNYGIFYHCLFHEASIAHKLSMNQNGDAVLWPVRR